MGKCLGHIGKCVAMKCTLNQFAQGCGFHYVMICCHILNYVVPSELGRSTSFKSLMMNYRALVWTKVKAD